jgi:hypothetical protein
MFSESVFRSLIWFVSAGLLYFLNSHSASSGSLFELHFAGSGVTRFQAVLDWRSREFIGQTQLGIKATYRLLKFLFHIQGNACETVGSICNRKVIRRTYC